MAITRRDFLNGVAVTIAAGLTPLEWVRAAGKGNAFIDGNYYPPALTGLRGNHLDRLKWRMRWVASISILI